MTVDITPLAAEGRLMVESYGPGRFRIAGQTHQGSILLSPETVTPWDIAAPDTLTSASLDILLARTPRPEVVLLGCGGRMALVKSAIRDAWRQRGLAVDIMDTGAACRTYNVLVTEDRLVVAALIAVRDPS